MIIDIDSFDRDMERIAVKDHPLSVKSYDDNEVAWKKPHAASPAASLIRSAARSILDDASSPKTSGDGSSYHKSYDNDGDDDGGRASATLLSLQKEQLPPIPDEQDRKRFIVSITYLKYVLFVGLNLTLYSVE